MTFQKAFLVSGGLFNFIKSLFLSARLVESSQTVCCAKMSDVRYKLMLIGFDVYSFLTYL